MNNYQKFVLLFFLSISTFHSHEKTVNARLQSSPVFCNQKDEEINLEKYSISSLRCNFTLDTKKKDEIKPSKNQKLFDLENQKNHLSSEYKVSQIGGHSLLWSFTNRTGVTVQFQFYSSDRLGWVWPDANKSFYIYPGQTVFQTINGLGGEKVCFGAWSQNFLAYWGAGPNAQYNCTKCCSYIGGAQVTHTLNW